MSDGVFEKIVVKPSVDLIPDEYELTGKIAVHTFTGDTENERESAQLFIKTLTEVGCDIEENIHSLENENFNETLHNINRDVDGLSGLILFFSYYCKDDGIINVLDGDRTESILVQNVIKEFTAYACRGLKNKPKIFIFHVKSPSLIQTDSGKYGTTYDVTYDTPGEADILIVYKKSESKNSLDFTQKLCSSIKQYGNIEDIVSLVTCLEFDHDDTGPLVVSTLTRKFYFTPGDHRGDHFHINQHQEEIKNHLQDIKHNLSNLKTTEKTKDSAVKKTKGGSVSYTKQKEVRKTTNARGSSNLPASVTESDGGGSNAKTATKIENRGSRSRLVSATTTDGTPSRDRLASSKSNASLTDKNAADDRPRWRY